MNRENGVKEISVVIPTFNGRKLLEEYLPSLKTALDAYPCDSEIIIVENGSSDDSVSFLSRTYPEVRVLKNSVNEGFGPAVNRGVREAKYGIVLLLNNDIRVEKDFIKPLVRHFDDPSVFAVVSKSLVNLSDRVINESVTIPGFDGGLLLSRQPLVQDKDREDIKNPCTNFHASGGFGAFDRKKFLELGGFDDIYHPFYYEDVDLSYQAWKRGWQVLYEPNSVVHHRSHATSRKVASDNYINRIEQRNLFLLTWKNISDPDFVYRHIKWLLTVILRSFSRGNGRERYLLRCILMALPRLPHVISSRIKNSRFTKHSDKRVFALASNVETPDLKFNRFVEANNFTPDKGIKILLIDPQGYQKGINVGLAYLSGALKRAGMINVEVLDLNNAYPGLTEDKIGRLLSGRGYDIIGFSIKTPTYKAAMEVSRITKKYLPKAVHIAGGPHITLNFNEFMKENPGFDYVNVGEGEYSFVEFCRMIASGKEYPIDGIMGRSSVHKLTAKSSFITNLDDLAYPDFDVFKGFDFTNFEYLLVTSRGCPYKCTYCSVGMISGSKMRFRKIESIVEELKWAKENLKIKRFNIIDDNFTLDISRTKEFCDRLIKDDMNLQWACGNGIRADRVDAELAGKMMKAGCNLVCVGVENADPKVFDTIKKGETLDDVKRGIGLLKDAGIEVVGFFIVGLPGDSKRSSEMSLEFIRESRLDSARFGILLPYPKTEVFDWIEKNGTFLKDYKEGIHFSDDLEPVYETKEFSARDMVETYKKLYTRLGYFTFLIPQDITATERLRRVLKLLWKYDKAGLLKTGMKLLRGGLVGI